MRDSRGQIWAAAFGGGLLRVRDPLDTAAIIERYEYEHRLAGSPRSLFEDREGNIWVGMRGGLLRLSESSFTSVAPLEGLTNEGVRTAAVGSDGSVWVATGHCAEPLLGLRSHGVQPVADDGAAQRSPRHAVGRRAAGKISRFVGTDGSSRLTSRTWFARAASWRSRRIRRTRCGCARRSRA